MSDLKALTNTLIAHRGYHDINIGIVENSIGAFKRAIRYGYAVELDVHLTKDSKVVVFHDDNLKRVCGVNKRIENCSYDELLKYNLFNTSYKIPLLKSVLNLIGGKVPILIETKVIKCDGKLEQELSTLLDNYDGKFFIQSFNFLSLHWFKKHRKNYKLGLLSGDFSYLNVSNLKRWVLKTLVFNILLKPDFIAYDINVLPNKYVELIKKRKPVLGWTIKDKKDYLHALKYCDGFICENIDDYYDLT